MPVTATRYFGELSYRQEDVFEFPGGVPGFEEYRRFLFIERPQGQPLVFMQSLDQPGLCFIAAPVSVAGPEYVLELAPDERTALDLPEGGGDCGSGVVCLGLIISSNGADPTINLASPIVLNPRSRKGVQAVQVGSRYSLRHPLLAREEAVQCS